MCIPSTLPVKSKIISSIQMELGCQSLSLPFPEILDLLCCELEYQKMNNSSKGYHGFVPFLAIQIIIYVLNI